MITVLTNEGRYCRVQTPSHTSDSYHILQSYLEGKSTRELRHQNSILA